VWLAILLLLASGYWMLFTTFGGFAGASLYIHLMQMIGGLMIALFHPHQYRATTGPLPKGSLPIGALPIGAATGGGSFRGRSAAIAPPTNATDARIPKRNFDIDTSHRCRQRNTVARHLFHNSTSSVEAVARLQTQTLS
jgi:hypothetical protein